MIDEVTGPKNDFYIKLTNEAAMLTVLSQFYNEEGEFVSNTADYAIDVVGVLHEPTGNTLTDDGMEYPEMAALDGWHVNIRLSSETMRDAVEALDVSHGVTPDAPRRVWL
jgi:hypothetical protein